MRRNLATYLGSGCSCLPPRTSAAEDARAIPTTSIRLQYRPRLVPEVGAPVTKRMETVEGITDVSSDREAGGLQLTVSIDRKKASSLGIRVQDIDNALNNAFSQRQISIVYTQRNQYQVILEIDPQLQEDPSNLERIFVAEPTEFRCRCLPSLAISVTCRRSL